MRDSELLGYLTRSMCLCIIINCSFTLPSQPFLVAHNLRSIWIKSTKSRQTNTVGMVNQQASLCLLNIETEFRHDLIDYRIQSSQSEFTTSSIPRTTTSKPIDVW